MPSIIIENMESKTVSCNPMRSILNNLLIAEVKIDTRCGGKAICGRCRIKVLNDSKFISPKKIEEKIKLKHLIDDGWRLACQTYSLRDIKIIIPDLDSDEGIIKKEE